jgi:hypothetical protein
MNAITQMNISADSSLTDLVSLARQVVKDLDHISVALSGGQDVLVKAREKAVAELSLFFVEVRRHEDIDLKVRQSCAEGIEELLDMYDCERAIKIIHRLPAAALAFGTIALALQSIDRCKHPLYCAVWSALQSPFFFSIERPWFRELEALWLFSRLRKDCSSRLPAHSTAILFKRTHPIFLRREDMYAKTHVAMYLTDFGRHKPTGFDAETLRLSLSHDLAWSLAMADWDFT